MVHLPVEPKNSLHLHCKGSWSFFVSKYMKLMFAGWEYPSTTNASLSFPPYFDWHWNE
ncbi:hypothetical protein PVAP13_9KG275800 [Panicum virgatum]|uniref:Uncharacterized protein n=1 Tax=Panicum virgatum TaxID=38727 RepID=A0A8T0NMX6_PANVG|nr:hypothetical protein PVAP13_9KG275800 [Panicum virgatum]KAG2549629.1 hypothetical protein PVAP13_9KG275800 [Panicum virgatum]